MTLLETFRDSEALEALALPDKIRGIAEITMIGMGLTFLALILVWAAVRLFSRIFGGKPLDEERPPTPPLPAPEEDIGARVAAIAAVLAVCREVPAETVRVKKIIRGPAPPSPWTGSRQLGDP